MMRVQLNIYKSDYATCYLCGARYAFVESTKDKKKCPKCHTKQANPKIFFESLLSRMLYHKTEPPTKEEIEAQKEQNESLQKEFLEVPLC